MWHAKLQVQGRRRRQRERGQQMQSAHDLFIVVIVRVAHTHTHTNAGRQQLAHMLLVACCMRHEACRLARSDSDSLLFLPLPNLFICVFLLLLLLLYLLIVCCCCLLFSAWATTPFDPFGPLGPFVSQMRNFLFNAPRQTAPAWSLRSTLRRLRRLRAARLHFGFQ